MQTRNDSGAHHSLTAPNGACRKVGQIAFSAVVVVAAACSANAAVGQDLLPMDEQERRTSTTPDTKELDAHAMVEALVNHNPAPKIEKHRSPLFDARYDWAEHKRAWKAIPILVGHAEDVWSELVEHLDDERYCTTVMAFSGVPYDWSVGDVCRMILSRNLSEAYYRNLKPMSLMVYGRLRRPAVARDKEFKSWCEERREKKLYELQIEMCEWAKTEIASPDNLPRTSQPTRRAWLDAIETEIESLRKSERAVPFGGFGTEEFTTYNAEWAERIRAGQREQGQSNN